MDGEVRIKRQELGGKNQDARKALAGLQVYSSTGSECRTITWNDNWVFLWRETL